jgi:hypothetical protein
MGDGARLKVGCWLRAWSTRQRQWHAAADSDSNSDGDSDSDSRGSRRGQEAGSAASPSRQELRRRKARALRYCRSMPETLALSSPLVSQKPAGEWANNWPCTDGALLGTYLGSL